MDKVQALKASRAAVEDSTKTARSRIASLLDPMSFVEIGAFAKSRATDFNMNAADLPADGVVTGCGTIENRPVFVYAQEPTVMGGAVGEKHAAKIVALYKKAVEIGAPVIGLIDSEGLRLQEETDSLTGYGKIYKAMSQASGVIPQIAVICGKAAGGAALIAGLSDFTFMIEKKSQLFVASANAMEKGTTFDSIAAAAVHAKKSGMADFACADEAECMAQVRTLFDMIPANNAEDAPIYEDNDDLNRTSDALNALAEGGAEFDVLPVLADIADANLFVETKAGYAPAMVTGFMRLNGGTVGVVANNGAVEGGALSVEACKKAVKMIKFCDAYELPILSVTNTNGFVASAAQENAGLAEAAAELAGAFAAATVTKINLIVGSCYGSAGMVMNSKASGADAVLAWPNAEIAVMASDSLARILYAKELSEGADLAEKSAKAAEMASPMVAAAHGLVDDVIEPASTRKYLLENFGIMAGKQAITPAKKHSAR